MPWRLFTQLPTIFIRVASTKKRIRYFSFCAFTITLTANIFSFATILDSDDPRPMMYIGDCHLAKGDKDKARAAYETSIEWAGKGKQYAQDLERARNMLENLQ